MKASRSLTVIVMMSLCSCASASPRYRLDITDNPEQKRFLLTLKSLDNRTLSISFQDWPNQFGQTHFGSTWVKLQTPQGVYPARDHNFGSCLGDNCSIEIPPGGELKGFIAYAEFGKPSVIAALPKRKLIFVVSPSVQKRSDRPLRPPWRS